MGFTWFSATTWNYPEMRFKTSRLECRNLTLSEYSSFEDGKEPNWSDLQNPFRHLIVGPSPLSFRIPRIKKDNEFAEIGLVLAIEKESNNLIGSAGFHDFPNPDGMIEIGFGIVPEMQGKGFGQELLLGMWKEIIKNPEVQVLRYTVSPENMTSLHIIEKFKFKKVGEQLDPEDGLELIFEMGKEEFQSLYGGDERI